MTQPSYSNPCNPVEQQARQDLLDDLYRRSGRDRKDHPLHASYTGLWMEWTQPPAAEQATPAAAPADSTESVPDLFDAWWKESFPHAPANKQSRENFIAFGTHLLRAHRTPPAGGAADAAN